MNGEIRTLIREVLGEELARLRTERSVASPPRPKVREEIVSITSDSDLAGFVSRLLELTRDGDMRRAIAEGRYVFRLGPRSQPAANPVSPAAPVPQTVRIERGFLSERQIDALPSATTHLAVGKAVRLTPLARDRLKARGIALERS